MWLLTACSSRMEIQGQTPTSIAIQAINLVSDEEITNAAQEHCQSHGKNARRADTEMCPDFITGNEITFCRTITFDCF